MYCSRDAILSASHTNAPVTECYCYGPTGIVFRCTPRGCNLLLVCPCSVRVRQGQPYILLPSYQHSLLATGELPCWWAGDQGEPGEGGCSAGIRWL